jgi:hypothetical protein
LPASDLTSIGNHSKNCPADVAISCFRSSVLCSTGGVCRNCAAALDAGSLAEGTLIAGFETTCLDLARRLFGRNRNTGRRLGRAVSLAACSTLRLGRIVILAGKNWPSFLRRRALLLSFAGCCLTPLLVSCAVSRRSGVVAPCGPQHDGSAAFGPISLDWIAAFPPWSASGRPQAVQVFIVKTPWLRLSWTSPALSFCRRTSIESCSPRNPVATIALP